MQREFHPCVRAHEVPARGPGRQCRIVPRRPRMQNDQNDRRKRAAVPTACGMAMTAPDWARSRGAGASGADPAIAPAIRVLEGSRSRTAGPVRAQCGRLPLRAERAQRATARSLRRLVQRLVVTSVRPHPASSSAERACQLCSATRQVCWCSGLLRRALVRAHQLAFALCSNA